jgi:8-oxo-dGTP diphosphatase/2-hydroxy-dATP diphosphatase
MSVKIYTLCVIHTDTHVLLGRKKRGLGEGKWNGFGGKVEQNEKIEDAGRREVLEEAGICVATIEKMGIVYFEYPGNQKNWEAHIFRTNEFLEDPTETEEMAPQWFAFDEIPFDDMWGDDKYWLPLLLKGVKFRGKFNFDAEGNLLGGGVEEVVEIGG